MKRFIGNTILSISLGSLIAQGVIHHLPSVWIVAIIGFVGEMIFIFSFND